MSLKSSKDHPSLDGHTLYLLFIAQNSEENLTKLIEFYIKSYRITNVVSGFRFRDEDEKDVVNDFFKSIIKKLRRDPFDKSGQPINDFDRYFTRGLKYQCIKKYQKKKNNRLDLQLFDYLPSTYCNAEDTLRYEDLRIAIAKLPHQELEIVKLKIEGLSRDNIAEITELTKGQVAHKLRVVRKKLKEFRR